MNDPILFVDLFCGIGGFRVGLEEVGMCVMSSEIDKFAVKTYAANFGETPRGNICEILPETIPDFDILTGGFPCQSFSSLGKREGFESETKGKLFFEIIRIVRAKQPKVLLLENVKGLLTHDKGATLARILQELTDVGYDVNYKVLNSADYGCPQNRNRVFFVCFRKDLQAEFEWPTPQAEKVGIGQFIETDIEGYSISKHLQDAYLFKKDDGRPRLVDRDTTTPTNTLVTSYHKIQRLTGTFVKDGPTGIRLFSKAECLAQQGFPADFVLPVSRTQMYRQLGNAVSPPVIAAIGANIKNVLICRKRRKL